MLQGQEVIARSLCPELGLQKGNNVGLRLNKAIFQAEVFVVFKYINLFVVI